MKHQVEKRDGRKVAFELKKLRMRFKRPLMHNKCPMMNPCWSFWRCELRRNMRRRFKQHHFGGADSGCGGSGLDSGGLFFGGSSLYSLPKTT